MVLNLNIKIQNHRSNQLQYLRSMEDYRRAKQGWQKSGKTKKVMVGPNLGTQEEQWDPKRLLDGGGDGGDDDDDDDGNSACLVFELNFGPKNTQFQEFSHPLEQGTDNKVVISVHLIVESSRHQQQVAFQFIALLKVQDTNDMWQMLNIWLLACWGQRTGRITSSISRSAWVPYVPLQGNN